MDGQIAKPTSLLPWVRSNMFQPGVNNPQKFNVFAFSQEERDHAAAELSTEGYVVTIEKHSMSVAY